MTDEYRDGIGAFRCKACGQAIRDGGDAPLVLIRQDDLEALVYLLSIVGDTLDLPITSALVGRLAQALGQSVAQIRARIEAAKP